jgi:hypothetical protein
MGSQIRSSLIIYFVMLGKKARATSPHPQTLSLILFLILGGDWEDSFRGGLFTGRQEIVPDVSSY